MLLIAGATLALSSCKDEDETTVAPYLSGSISFTVEQFVNPGQTVKMTPTGLSHPEDKNVGYFWKVTPDMTKNDTTRYDSGLSPEGKESDGSFTYTFRDSLATYTITCTGYADGYSNSYTTSYVTVVKPGLNGSITGTGISRTDDSIYEGNGLEYYYINHNGVDWMRNSLANPAYGAPYANSEAMSNVMGRYYSYEEALEACPDGWRLPTDREWCEMAESITGHKTEAYNTIPEISAALMGNVQFNLETMWEYWPAVGEITNLSGLAMIPAGYSNLSEKQGGKYPGATFRGIDEYSVFWTADKVENEEGMAYYRYIICDEPDMYVGKADIKTFGANVRCVRTNEDQ